jgi:hypothetical protein
VDLFSAQEDGLEDRLELYIDYTDSDPDSLLDRSFWLSYARIRLFDQFKVVIPLLLYMFLYGVAVLREAVEVDLAIIASAMLLVIVGLALFLEGLKLGVMPLGEAVGKTLPVKCPLWATLGIAFLLGVAVTFAEPAIGALQEAGDSIDSFKSPYLYFLLNQWELYVVIMVGAGVGAAAVVGTLRFMYEISIKPIIYCAVSLTLLMTVLATFVNSGAAQIIGLAWDCGAVTTGPVTVPILLAIGLGISAATKDAKALAAKQPNEAATEEGVTEGGALEGFGIVTLASLFPVIGVYTLGFVLTNIKSVDDVLAEVHGECYLISPQGPCEDIPTCLWNPSDERCEVDAGTSESVWYEQTPAVEALDAVTALGPLVLLLTFILRVLGEPIPVLYVRAHDKVCKMQVYKGLACVLLGLAIFNIGLTKGLSQLGSDIGNALPRAFEDTSIDDSNGNGTPYFERAEGIALSLIFVWFLGLGSTFAEPALSTLGLTVEAISKGKFHKNVIVYSVGFGVATGLTLGALKVINSLPLVYFILPLYPLAMLISSQSGEDVVNIAWDSAGVTTGPVTVPLVLALGAGIGSVVVASEEGGFGMLTLSSIGPILSVLISDFLHRAINKRSIISEFKFESHSNLNSPLGPLLAVPASEM